MKLDLSEGNDFGGGVDNRAGAFVMYNCARLATLFKHFNKAVDDGINFFLHSSHHVLSHNNDQIGKDNQYWQWFAAMLLLVHIYDIVFIFLGIYPPLPNLDSIDFSLLREEVNLSQNSLKH